MKKVFLVFGALVLLTGCNKNYKTVDEYNTAMDAVKSKVPAYTAEATQEVYGADLYYRTYIKGDKWKLEASMNGGKSYMTTVLYDGSDLWTYSAHSVYAVKNPAVEMLGSHMNPADIKNIIDMQNPVLSLINWRHVLTDKSSALDEDNVKFVNQKVTMNGFDCRMIDFGDGREACINDNYGIAVYHKFSAPNLGNQSEILETTLNLVKVDTSDIPDSVFEFPAGVKKADMDTMLNDLKKMW